MIFLVPIHWCNYKVLVKQARYFKEDKEILESMCKVVEDMTTEEIKENDIAIVIRMLKDGKLSEEEIAKYLDWNEEEVENGAESVDATVFFEKLERKHF